MESEYSFFTKNQDDIIKISRMLHVKSLFTLCMLGKVVHAFVVVC